MNQTPARPSSLRATVFRDGLGERRRMADASGVDKLEILCIHRDLAERQTASNRPCASVPRGWLIFVTRPSDGCEPSSA